METEIRFYYANESKKDLIDYLKSFKELSYKGRYHEITDQYNHPMKEYDFYSKEIDGRLRVRKTTSDTETKCMVSWKRRLKDNVKELIHQEEEVELSINPSEYENLCYIFKYVIHLELVESYERYRNLFCNSDIEIVIDEYPFGLCLEIESKSETILPKENIQNWVNKLKIDINDAYRLSWDDKYAELCREKNLEVNSIVRFTDSMPQIENKFIIK
jgi:hypothetical protein